GKAVFTFCTGTNQYTYTHSNSSFKPLVSVFFVTKETNFEGGLQVTGHQFTFLIQILTSRIYILKKDLILRAIHDNTLILEIHITHRKSDTGCKTKIGFFNREIIT